MPHSQRCSKCQVYWPSHCTKCPDCKKVTVKNSVMPPLSKDAYDARMRLVRYRDSGFQLVDQDAEALAQFDSDWNVAEDIAKTHGLDMSDLIVAKRKKAA